ncbi:MAG: hypothetical protein ACJ77Z_17555, partial [Thermoleophilaceae bacterium]
MIRRRTRWGCLPVVAVVTAALASNAYAGARVDYKQMFTTPLPGTSTGTDTWLLYKNPNDPTTKPIPVRREQFTFPDGTTYDDSVVPFCHASDLELMLLGTSACPADTWLGGDVGEDTVMAGFDKSEQRLDVNGWNNGPNDMIMLGGSHDIKPWRFVTHVRRGSGQTRTAEIAHSPGGPPDGETALRRIHHVFGARNLGDRGYMRTPPTCPPSGEWTFKGQFTFADGVVEADRYDMPCQR